MSNETNEQNDNIANLRKAADEGSKAKQEAERLARENAMLRAGVDLDSKAGTYFAKGYDGELTADAIKAEAAEIPGVLRGQTAVTPPPAAPEPNVDEGAADERLGLASNAGKPNVDEGVDPYTGAMKAFDEALFRNPSRERAATAALSKIVEAANSGDKRVIL